MVAQPGAVLVWFEDELLDDVGDRAAGEPEIDAVRSGEAHRLDGGGHQPTPHGRAVRSEHHVAAAFEYQDLLGDRAGLPAQVRFGQDVEDDFARGGDLDVERAELRIRRPTPRSIGIAPVTSPR